MSRESSAGSVPPKTPARLIVICTNGRRHDRIELLSLSVVFDATGRPTLAQNMSTQPRSPDKLWTPVMPAVRADDGHLVISRQCSQCPTHFKRGAAELATWVAAIAPGTTLVVDISAP